MDTSQNMACSADKGDTVEEQEDTILPTKKVVVIEGDTLTVQKETELCRCEPEPEIELDADRQESPSNKGLQVAGRGPGGAPMAVGLVATEEMKSTMRLKWQRFQHTSEANGVAPASRGSRACAGSALGQNDQEQPVKDVVFEDLQQKWRRMRGEEEEQTPVAPPPPPPLRPEFKVLVAPLPVSVSLGAGPREQRDGGKAAGPTPRGTSTRNLALSSSQLSPGRSSVNASPRGASASAVVPLPALGLQEKGRLASAGALISQVASPRPAVATRDEQCAQQ